MLNRNALCSVLLAVGLLLPFTHLAADEGAKARNDRMGRLLGEIPRGTPVVMLNMLKFRETAEYPEGGPQLSGREAYARYRKAASKLVAEVGGGPVWSGNAKAAIIAPDGEQWDEVFLVRYPSIEKFLQMISSQAYQDVVVHRSAALADSRLIATVESE